MGTQFWLFLLSIAVIFFYGYRKFNQWTEAETRAPNSDSDLLAFAPPRSFTSLGRFTTIACVYCMSLVALYCVLYVLFYFAPEVGLAKFLGVNVDARDSAWLLALLVLTGLSTVVPGFSHVELALRQVMHTWAVVPTKAELLANQIAAPTTRFQLDEAYLRAKVLPRLAPRFAQQDATDAEADTIAEKWCRLHYMLGCFAPWDKGGLQAAGLKMSPYIVRFQSDLESLTKDIETAAAADVAALRRPADSPATVALADRVDSVLHRLYVLICCRAFSSTRSLDGVAEHLSRKYGIVVPRIEFTTFPAGPVFDTLFVVTGVVFAIGLVFVAIWPDAKAQVQPLVWALSCFAVHGSGMLIGWWAFTLRKRRWLARVGHYLPVAAPLSRLHMVTAATVSFGLALVPTWLASMYYLESMWSHNKYAFVLEGLMLRALHIGWPWALLGSATAVAVYWHLERSANQDGSRRLAAISAAAQACANLAISISIMVIYSPDIPGLLPDVAGQLQEVTLAMKLADPVMQLVLVLTGAIGVTLGLCLPRTVRGHGLDQRGGAKRYRPQAESRAAQLNLHGRRVRCEIDEISRSGCVLRAADADIRAAGRGTLLGQLTLADRTALPVRIARDLPEAGDAAGAATSRIAVEFTSEPGYRYLPKGLSGQLQRFLAGPGFQTAASGDD